MSTASGRRFSAACFRSRLTIEDDGRRLVFHHFDRDPVGAAFGTLWLCGWMGGIVLVAHGTPWPWPRHDGLMIAAMLGIWLLCAFAVVSALVQRARLIVTADAITFDQWVLVHVVQKTIPAAELKEMAVEQRNRRGGPYHVIVIKGQRKTIRFGDGIDRQTLMESMHRIRRQVAALDSI